MDSTHVELQVFKLGAGLSMAWLASYDADGLGAMGFAVAADDEGHVYVCGTEFNASGGTEFLTLKFDPMGELLWKKVHKPHADTAMAIAARLAVHARGVVVTGASFDGVSLNFTTLKYSTDGDLEWAADHGVSGITDKAMTMAMDNGGIIYVSGISGVEEDWTYTTVKYDVFRKRNDAVLDSLDNPQFMANEVIVKFRPHLVDTSFVDSQDWQHGTLKRILPDSVVDALAAKFGLEPGALDRVKVVKVFRQLTRADSISISRLGDEVRMPKFWSTFVMTSDMIGEYARVVADSLNTVWDFVEYAEPNYLFTLFDPPNDPLYEEQLCLSHEIAGINIEAAWDISTGSSYIKVGVVDVIIHWDHEEFGNGSMYGTKVTGGRDFNLNIDLFEIDLTNLGNSHGTAVAGIIGAERNNNTGIAGIAGGDAQAVPVNRGVQLISLGIYKPTAPPTYLVDAAGVAEAILNGIYDAVGGFGYGCHVLNNSYGRYEWDSPEELNLLRSVVMAGYRNGCVFVAARGYDHGTTPCYPACFLPETAVISVGASGTTGDYYTDGWTSDYGVNLDLVAPAAATHIRVPILSEGYANFDGTSAAAPHVAGVAALMLSHHNTANLAPNNLAPEDVEWIIELTATDIGEPDYDELTGFGRLNAGAALVAISDPFCVIHSGTLQPPISISESSIQEIQVLPFNDWDLIPGSYNARLVEVTFVNYDELAPTADIIGHWGRLSSTKGTHPSTQVDGHPWAELDFEVDGNSAEVTATSYCWRIADVYMNGMHFDEMYLPSMPEDLYVAYSLHVRHGDLPVGSDQAAIGTGLLIFPNPADDVLNLTLNGLDGSEWSIDIVDALGRIQYTSNISARSGSMSTIPIASLARGTYCLRLKSDRDSHSARFVKH
jgi:subtilisin family serine protease